ncbi:hypothetical protein [Acinetobacter baumannii]|uniref:hypothetical protein n=1 Tax=Acinetobacter baumannii TaxID=470 RepID=UPI00366E11F1
MPYTLVDEDWWKGKVLPAVKEENEEAFKVLNQLTSDYERFGINGTRAIRVCTFVPSVRLSCSFNFESTSISRVEWGRIDMALDRRGIYDN